MKPTSFVAGRSFAAALVTSAASLLLGCGSKPAEVRLTPPKLTFYGPARSLNLKFDVLDKKGRPIPGATVTWTSDKPKVVTVDANGILHSVGPGRAVVTAATQNVSGSANVEVVDAVSLLVSPNRMTLVGPPGATMALQAEVKDGKGNLVALKPKWTTGDQKIAVVDANGVVTSVSEGRTTVIASLGADLSSACDVRVMHRDIAVFEITPLTLILKVGETQRINAVVKDSGGAAIEDAALAWTSSDPRTAVVSNGAVTGVARGTAVISVATSARTLTATAIVN
jgi:uncharacterized protein YjdB